MVPPCCPLPTPPHRPFFLWGAGRKCCHSRGRTHGDSVSVGWESGNVHIRACMWFCERVDICKWATVSPVFSLISPMPGEGGLGHESSPALRHAPLFQHQLLLCPCSTPSSSHFSSGPHPQSRGQLPWSSHSQLHSPSHHLCRPNSSGTPSGPSPDASALIFLL